MKTPARIELRSARPGDERLICRFIRELAEYEKLGHEVEATEKAIAAALFAPNPHVFCEIAEIGSEAAGFALWFYSFSTFQARNGIYLEDIYVMPAMRRRGAGKALLSHLAKRAVSEGCGRFEWRALDWNATAIGFYKSLGARPLGGWTAFRLDGEALKRLADR